LIDKIKKNIITAIILTSLVYLGFSLYADFDSVVNIVTHFDYKILVIVLLLTSTNFFLRFLKWHYYIRLLEIPAKFGDSFLIFLSGLVMSVTPGKFGEVFKSYLLKNVTQTPISKSASIVFAERITDFFSVLLIALFGALVYDSGILLIILISLLFIAITLVINNRALSLRIIGYFGRIKFIGKHTDKIKTAYESSYKMLKLKPLYKMTFLSLFAWLPECFGFYLILTNFDVPISLFWSIFVYAFSIIIGALTLLPAGIGITEGSLTYFIFQKINSLDTAVSITLIIRVLTLWYAVFIGILSLSYFKKKKKLIDN